MLLNINKKVNDLNKKYLVLTLFLIVMLFLLSSCTIPTNEEPVGARSGGEAQPIDGGSRWWSPICKNECSTSGAKRCSLIAAALDGYQICGNYDADSCLEWGTVTSCNVGQTCSNGNCVSPQVCTPGTIQTGTTCNVCNSQGIGYTQDNSRCLQGYFCDKTIYKCCDATGNCY